MTDQLRVVETYQSFQGTGAKIGERQFFIRLAKLEEHGLVRSERDGKQRRFFPIEVSP